MSAAIDAVAALERRIRDLEAENAILRDGLGERPDFTAFVFKLTKQEGRLLACLVKRGQAGRETLMIAAHDADVKVYSKDWKIIDVLVCRIRQKLKPWGLQIETLWGFGYSMTEDDRAKVRAIMGEAEGK